MTITMTPHETGTCEQTTMEKWSDSKNGVVAADVTENPDDRTLADFLDSDEPDITAKTLPFLGYIDGLKEKGDYSYHRTLSCACTNRTVIEDSLLGDRRDMIVMFSNNYLGLNTRPEVIEAACRATQKYGSGMGGSRFFSGTYDLLNQLEAQLADFERQREAMVFTTGYQANVGVISALLRKRDVAFIDRLSHASIIDGCRLAGCSLWTFRHNDMNSLEKLLSFHAHKYRGKLIIVEGIFSMDGDMAPLPEILDLAAKYGTRVMVDEAHATGVVGPKGRGTVEYFNADSRVDIVMGTFSKIFAATGGYIAASREIVNYVRHYGRSYMFSASPTPATVASVLAALNIVKREPELRLRLWENIRYFHKELKQRGFTVYPDPPQSAIVTIPLGCPDGVVHAMSKDIFDEGILMSSVVYPAVPKNKGRLRISLSATHTREDMDRTLDALTKVGRKFAIV
jgi:glycine C-acetyltransferase